MAFNISSKKIDLNKLDDGSWVNLSDNEENGSIKVARLNNKKMTEFLDKKVSDYKKQNRNKEVPAETFEEFFNEALSKFVLLDWKNVFISEFASEEELEAESMQYTDELGFKIFSDESYIEFKGIVADAATNIENFRAEYSETFKKK